MKSSVTIKNYGIRLLLFDYLLLYVNVCVSDGKFIKIDGMKCSHSNSDNNLERAKSKCSMDSNCTAILDQYCNDFRTTFHYQFCNDKPVPHGNTQDQTGFSWSIQTQKDLSCVWKKIDPDCEFAYINQYNT